MSKSLTFLYVAAPRLFMLNFLRLSRHNTVLVLWLCSGTESTRSGSENIVVWRFVPVWFASWSQSVWLMWCSWCATHSNHDHICGDTLAANFTSWTDRGATWLNICYTSSPVYSSNIRRIFLSVIISEHYFCTSSIISFSPTRRTWRPDRHSHLIRFNICSSDSVRFRVSAFPKHTLTSEVWKTGGGVQKTAEESFPRPLTRFRSPSVHRTISTSVNWAVQLSVNQLLQCPAHKQKTEGRPN